MNLDDILQKIQTLQNEPTWANKTQINHEIEALIEEIRTYQVELEMQNEELRSAYQKLDLAQEKYRDLYHTAPVGYMTFDQHGLITGANRTAGQMLNLNIDNLIGRTLVPHLNAESIPRFYEHCVQVLTNPSTAENNTCELIFEDSNEQQRHMLLKSLAIQDEDAEFTQIRSALLDITQQKKTELGLLQLRTAVEKMELGVIITDTVGTVTYINPAAADMHGYLIEDLLRQPLNQLTPLALHSTVSTTYIKTMDNQIVERLHLHKNGVVFPVQISTAIVSNNQGSPVAVVITCEDITNRKRAEEAIHQLNDELEKRVSQRTRQLELANQELEQEINERKQAEARLLHMALHDSLTHLPNRITFREKLEHALNRTKREPPYKFAVLFLDCDRFKLVNDSLGHLVGDTLLIAVARRLQECIRNTDIIARFGGDEFTILMDDVYSIEEVKLLAERIQQQLLQPLKLAGQEIIITVSIGIVMGSPEYEHPEQVLRDADTAMYQAKAMGKSRYQIFTPKMHTQAVTMLQLEGDLRRALEQENFEIYYQPIVGLADNKLIGFETLIRWHHPDRGLIPPIKFIPVAEDTELIIPIDRWMLRQVCKQLQIWNGTFPRTPPLILSVNLSAKQFSHPDLVDSIRKILYEMKIEGHQIKLEITESAMMGNAKEAFEAFEQLRETNIQLCIDDFGTGYSSFNYLHKLPVHTLKIDRSFIYRINPDGENLEIVQGIITLAHSLGLDVIAEGVETEEQLRYLREIYCDYGQGYYFSKPVPVAEAEKLLSKKKML